MSLKNPNLSGLHPSVDALIALLDELTALSHRYHNALHSVLVTDNTISPSNWSQKIESAVDDENKLGPLRVEFRELAITWLHDVLAEDELGNRMHPLQQKVLQAVGDVVREHDALKAADKDNPLLACLEGAALIALDVFGRERRGAGAPAKHSNMFSRADRIMRETFIELSKTLQTMQTDRYPEERACPKQIGHRDFIELRRVRAIPNSHFPDANLQENAKLADMLFDVYQFQEVVLEAFKQLRSEYNGSVNERQHGVRMIDMLLEERVTRLDQSGIDEQNERRWRYETARQHFALLLKTLRSKQRQLAATLKQASEEAMGFIEPKRELSTREIGVQQCAAVRTAMNNCLAADVCLRDIGRDLREYGSVLDKDLADGNGAKALNRLFEEVAANYRPTNATK